MEIRDFQRSDLDAIVEFSLRAWEPIFASLRTVLGDQIFFRAQARLENFSGRRGHSELHQR
jgi:hypothetical protein